ncbi:MAG: transporter [Opitutaceae bacterium]|nr:transporter [Opitutaceae bacterium]
MEPVYGPNLTIWDLLVLSFYLLFMFGIGFVYKSFSKDNSDYFRGGGSMLWWMVGASAFMTQFSAWTFTGAAGKAYTDGTLVSMIFFGNAVGYLGNYLVTSYRFRRMRVITPIDSVRVRFGAFNEQVFTWTQIPQRVLYAGIWLNGLAIVVSSVFKIDPVITVWVVGLAVVVMSVAGGAWAVIASDFIQVLLLMCITLVTCVLALSHPAIGGLGGLIDKVPDHHFSFSLAEDARFVYIWIFTAFVVQSFKINNMFDSYRYLCVKNDSQARKASMMACLLMLVGPLIWFIPPMVARVLQPDMASVFPALANPNEGAFLYTGMVVLPVGMIGLLVCALFAATMSSMDSGLNVNAGIIVNNFYKPVLRKNAGEKELLLVGKVMSGVFGILIIMAGLLWLNLKDWDLFEIMTVFGSMVGIPIAMPLVWGLFIKSAPRWSAWSTVLVGVLFSWFSLEVKDHGWLGVGELGGREKSDFLYFFSGLGNVIVCSVWFFITVAIAKWYQYKPEQHVEEFFENQKRPMGHDAEGGEDKDNRQSQAMGFLCLIYGAFIAVLGIVIPNSMGGRISFLFCGMVIGGIGYILRRSKKKTKEIATG